ncbi:MAG TPA: carboxymuconolactone decarboxylase family protein [Dehalococcoidia bacterium]|nr:carboxymuconolactone decarboxylase family protein [Dehalococcoidia bacterium]
MAEPYSEEVAAGLAKWMPPGAAVEPLLLFRTILVNTALSDAMRQLGSHILGRRYSLSLRERELLIDRTCARCGAEYEWGVHASAFGAAAGLTPAELDATLDRVEAHAWPRRDALLIRTVDALHDVGRIPDELWQELAAEWSPPQLLDIVATVGYYHLISFLCNAAELPLESWAARFPAPQPAGWAW